jgi:hypothetical protein
MIHGPVGSNLTGACGSIASVRPTQNASGRYKRQKAQAAANNRVGNRSLAGYIVAPASFSPSFQLSTRKAVARTGSSDGLKRASSPLLRPTWRLCFARLLSSALRHYSSGKQGTNFFSTKMVVEVRRFVGEAPPRCEFFHSDMIKPRVKLPHSRKEWRDQVVI